MTQRAQTRLKQIGVAMLAVLVVGALTTASAQNATIAVQSFQDRIQFHAQTSDVEKLQLDVFDLSGSTVYDSDWASGRSLSWGLSTDDGQSVANGVYLYALRTRDVQGNVERYIGKLAVLEGKLQSADRSPQRAPKSNKPSSEGTVRAQAKNFGQPVVVNTNKKFGFKLNMSGGGAGRFRIAHDANAGFNLVKKAGSNPKQVFAFAVFESGSDNLFTIWNNSKGEGAVGIDGQNRIGLGTTSPDSSAKVTVADDSATNLIVAKDTSGGSAQTVFRVERASGDAFADGSFNGGGADVAERIDVTTPVEAGDVVAIDPTASGKFRKAQAAKSRRVAGVISTDPGVVLGNRSVTAQGNQRDTRPLLALAGRVPVKATAKYGAIEAGDTLVSAPIPGYAQVCASDCTGAVLGKALESLEEGTGKITVQVSLR